jgi:hypothetical protein
LLPGWSVKLGCLPLVVLLRWLYEKVCLRASWLKGCFPMVILFYRVHIILYCLRKRAWLLASCFPMVVFILDGCMRKCTWLVASCFPMVVFILDGCMRKCTLVGS